MKFSFSCLLVCIFLFSSGSSDSRVNRIEFRASSRSDPLAKKLKANGNFCSPSCQNGGTCYNGECWCTPEWKGTYCQYHKSRCLEHGLRQLGGNGRVSCEETKHTRYPFTCTLICDKGYFEFQPAPKYKCDYTTGKFKPSKLPRCLSEPEVRTEIVPTTSYPHPFYPTTLYPNYYPDSCHPTCQNGGTCQDSKCMCPIKWKGTYCQYHRSTCTYQTLIDLGANGGMMCMEYTQFSNTTVPYICYLKCEGYFQYPPPEKYTCDYATGLFDHTNVPRCLPDHTKNLTPCNPRCRNGGNCIRGHRTRSYCQCLPGFTGKSCQYRLTEQPDFCYLGPLKAGQKSECLAYIPKWTYNKRKEICQEIIYGGCGGTKNLFDTREECQQICALRE